MKINRLNEIIAECIPNSLLEVAGETPLAVKLTPWIQSAKNWLESEYLGPDDFLNEEDNARAIRIVVLKAFADAVPSLDLVVTPTGFGVVNTETIVPASKERIERLLESLRSQIDGELDLLLELCHQYPEWRVSEHGKYFCSTFLSNPKNVKLTGTGSFDDMRSIAIQVENIIARDFLGLHLMNRLRDEYNARNHLTFLELHEAVRSVVIECVRIRVNKGILTHSTVWNLCQTCLLLLQNDSEYHTIWHDEMGSLFNHMQFKNNIKGSYFF